MKNLLAIAGLSLSLAAGHVTSAYPQDGFKLKNINEIPVPMPDSFRGFYSTDGLPGVGEGYMFNYDTDNDGKDDIKFFYPNKLNTVRSGTHIVHSQKPTHVWIDDNDDGKINMEEFFIIHYTNNNREDDIKELKKKAQF